MKIKHTLIAASLLLAASAQAQTVSVIQAQTNVSVGDTFKVELQATGFPNKIFGGGYNLSFDPTKLQLDAIDIPAATWEFARSNGTLNAAAGTVTDIYFNTFAAPIAGDFLTAAVSFKAIAAGTSAITVSESISFPFGDEFAAAVPVTYVGGLVTAVPEPGALGLVLAGIACVAWTARRRQG